MGLKAKLLSHSCPRTDILEEAQSASEWATLGALYHLGFSQCVTTLVTPGSLPDWHKLATTLRSSE